MSRSAIGLFIHESLLHIPVIALMFAACLSTTLYIYACVCIFTIYSHYHCKPEKDHCTVKRLSINEMEKKQRNMGVSNMR